MLTSLNESKIKHDIKQEEYENKIIQYKKEIYEFGTITFVNMINDIFGINIINKLFENLDELQMNDNKLKIDYPNNYLIFGKNISLICVPNPIQKLPASEINIVDIIKENYIKNNFKFNLIQFKQLQLCNNRNDTDILENEIFQKTYEILNYCDSKNICYSNKYLFGKNKYSKNCKVFQLLDEDPDYYHYRYGIHKHSYIFCSDCSLAVFKDKNITKVYKNPNSSFNNVSINLVSKYNGSSIDITIDCDITNLYKIDVMLNDIIKILQNIKVNYDYILKNIVINTQIISTYLEKIKNIESKISLISDNKLDIKEVEDIYNNTLQINKDLNKILNPSNNKTFNFISKLFTKNKKSDIPPSYDTISIRTNPPEYEI